MDNFFQNSTETFLSQFESLVPVNLHSGALLSESGAHFGGMEADDLIDDSDDIIHDKVMALVYERPRLATEDFPQELTKPVPKITNILESLRCCLCLYLTATPVFVKHCLHFFCKDCIEQQLRL